VLTLFTHQIINVLFNSQDSINNQKYYSFDNNHTHKQLSICAYLCR
jgi:hypothetical protein